MIKSGEENLVNPINGIMLVRTTLVCFFVKYFLSFLNLCHKLNAVFYEYISFVVTQ